MPVYKADLTIEVDGDDITWLDDVHDYLSEHIDGVSISFFAPHADNPDDYPETD